jgi:hypothetical protein
MQCCIFNYISEVTVSKVFVSIVVVSLKSKEGSSQQVKNRVWVKQCPYSLLVSTAEMAIFGKLS